MFNKMMIATVLALGGLSVSVPAQVSLAVGIRGHDGPRVSAGVTFGSHRRAPEPRYRAPRTVSAPRYPARARTVARGRGQYEQARVRVWVPGGVRRELVPAEFGWRFDSCGQRVRFMIRVAHYRTVHEPGHWEYRTEQVWVPARRRPR